MAMWVCPHCGAPQAETARCWVCRRSSTTCSTCRHFRASLAADVGFCAKDRWRTPLTGLELRACWEEGRRVAAAESTPSPAPGDDLPLHAGTAVAGAASEAERPQTGRGSTERRTWTIVRGDGGPLDRPDPMRLRGFIPIEEIEPVAAQPPADSPAPRPTRAAKRTTIAAPIVRRADHPLPVDDWETRVSLFGEAEL